MTIKPTQLSIKSLFEQNHTFEVPKYQRGYAWDDEAIEDFVEDIGRCLKAHELGNPRNHFFGGIVTVRKNVNNSNRSNYEVIDGQQRLASFVMLIAAVVSRTKLLVEELAKREALSEDENKAKTFLQETIEALRRIFLAYKDEIELTYVDIPKLTLSNADKDFFLNIISDRGVSTSRASHERIQAAWERLLRFVDTDVLTGTDTSEKAKHLKILVNNVLVTDCTVIFMCSETHSEAYQIFQVLNDRGVHLTDGDLLRASTMERLDSGSLRTTQTSLAECWDRILAYPPYDLDSYFPWYFSSMQGERPKSSSIVEQFLEYRFEGQDTSIATVEQAESILREAEQIDSEFVILEKLGNGDWPYEDHTGVLSWDRERLRMLVTHLKHTNAMPLLLSLQKLEPSLFAEAVSSIERFVFRFKIIGQGHANQMTNVYLRHAVKIREENTYSIESLREDLVALINRVVPDSVFEANLRNRLVYSPRTGNSDIRYFLITLEDHIRWYETGAPGIPKCIDKTRIFDFSNTTLEHIYPKSARASERSADLEEVKHTIGNLTIFGPGDNESVSNKSFVEKRMILQDSNLKLNREIGQKEAWTSANVNSRTDELVRMALKVFVP